VDIDYSKELWSNNRWRYPRGLLAKDFDHNARVMLVSIIASGAGAGLTHFVLARATVDTIGS
jgi:hypothetical protein